MRIGSLVNVYEQISNFVSVYNSLRTQDAIPPRVSLELTYRCNARCIFCDRWKASKENELTTKEWKRVIYDLSKVKVQKVSIGGG